MKAIGDYIKLIEEYDNTLKTARELIGKLQTENEALKSIIESEKSRFRVIIAPKAKEKTKTKGGCGWCDEVKERYHYIGDERPEMLFVFCPMCGRRLTR